MLTIPNALQKPLVIDTSKWNGKLTREQIESTGCKMLVIRAGISWGYQDPLYEYYRDLADSMGLARSAYHVLYPSQEASYQFENLKIIIDDNPGDTEIPIWNDLELHQNMPPNRINEVTMEFNSLVQKEYGKKAGIYSRSMWITRYLNWRSWLSDVYWWFAQYLYSGLEHPGPYRIPVGVPPENVLMIQTTEKGKILNHRGDVDFNRFIAGETKLNWLINKEIEPPPVLSLEALEKRISQLEKTVYHS